MKYYLTVHFRKLKNGDHGKIKPVGVKGNRYLITIDSQKPMVERIGTLVHEFAHFLFYVFFEVDQVSEKKEHTFCEGLDDDAQRRMKKYLGVR